MRASRSRSCTWFSAEAPEERSITPKSTTSPCPQGKSAPKGARSMKPAAAETSTSRTMPNFESSAYVPARSTKAEVPRARATAPSALGGTGRSPDTGAGGHCRATPHHAPAPRVHREPDEHGPQRVGDHRVGGADRCREPSHHGGDAERHLQQRQAHHESGGLRQRSPSSRQGQVEEEAEERYPEPAVDPAHGALPVMGQQAAAAEREVRAGQPRARVAYITAEGELGEEHPQAGPGQALEFSRNGGMRAIAVGQYQEAGEDQERVHEMGRAHE